MRILTLATLVLLANSASAESLFELKNRLYVGGGINFVNANATDTAGNDLSFTALEGLAGYKYNGFLGVEFRAGVGITEETITINTAVVESTLDHYASFYWRPETANEVAKIYGLLGFTTLTFTFENGATSVSNSESGLSYGGGVGFVFEEVWNLNFEYRFILDKDANEFSSFAANVDYRF